MWSWLWLFMLLVLETQVKMAETWRIYWFPEPVKTWGWLPENHLEGPRPLQLLICISSLRVWFSGPASFLVPHSKQTLCILWGSIGAKVRLGPLLYRTGSHVHPFVQGDGIYSRRQVIGKFSQLIVTVTKSYLLGSCSHFSGQCPHQSHVS